MFETILRKRKLNKLIKTLARDIAQTYTKNKETAKKALLIAAVPLAMGITQHTVIAKPTQKQITQTENIFSQVRTTRYLKQKTDIQTQLQNIKELLTSIETGEKDEETIRNEFTLHLHILTETIEEAIQHNKYDEAILYLAYIKAFASNLNEGPAEETLEYMQAYIAELQEQHINRTQEAADKRKQIHDEAIQKLQALKAGVYKYKDELFAVIPKHTTNIPQATQEQIITELRKQLHTEHIGFSTRLLTTLHNPGNTNGVVLIRALEVDGNPNIQFTKIN